VEHVFQIFSKSEGGEPILFGGERVVPVYSGKKAAKVLFCEDFFSRRGRPAITGGGPLHLVLLTGKKEAPLG